MKTSMFVLVIVRYLQKVNCQTYGQINVATDVLLITVLLAHKLGSVKTFLRHSNFILFGKKKS